MAIVAYCDGERTSYISLICTEAPEARFTDIMQLLYVGKGDTEHEIDPRYIASCVPGSIEVVSVVPHVPVTVGAYVRDNKVVISTISSLDRVNVMLSGLRRGHPGRFVEYTKEDMDRNMAFWDSWRK